MSKDQPYIFVLWGDHFREADAAIFVTVLRETGLRVKVVGLTPHQPSGANGLALVPDLSLDQALPLAAQATGVIIPATLPGLKRLQNDPRISEFLRQADLHQARFVLGAMDQAEVAALEWFPFTCERVSFYPPCEDLVVFVQRLATRLTKVDNKLSPSKTIMNIPSTIVKS